MGSQNTAVGGGALQYSNRDNNTALGYFAGSNISVGGNNIDIGNLGTAADRGTIRIGTPRTQTSCFAAGVRGVTTGNPDAIPVVIDIYGQLA